MGENRSWEQQRALKCRGRATTKSRKSTDPCHKSQQSHIHWRPSNSLGTLTYSLEVLSQRQSCLALLLSRITLMSSPKTQSVSSHQTHLLDTYMLSPCTQDLFPLNPDISPHFIEFSQSWQPIQSLYLTPGSFDSKTSTQSRAPRFWFLFSLIRGNQGRIYGMSTVLLPSVI